MPDTRRPVRPAGRDFFEALDNAGGEIRDPVAKLKYLRNALERAGRTERAMRFVPYAPLRRTLYRWLHLEGLQLAARSRSLGAPLSLRPTSRRALRLARAGAALAVLAVAGGAFALWRLAMAPSAAASASLRAGAPAPPVSTPAPEAVAGVKPAGIWLVETGQGFEQYSNGLRVENGLSVAGEERRYRVFDVERGLRAEVERHPVGILFHTTESDIWPLESSFNENLRDSSQRLLQYIRRNRLYHFVVDRFGRVYRIVAEEAKANHAGHSVWSSGRSVYLSLNHSFLGVSFETRWEGGRALPITQAQFTSGRSLTEYLRERWRIAEDMCVAHGLTSVNPRLRRIGHHLDWARGFPFGAFGLPDQYGRPPPSVALFGFRYDEDFLAVLGDPWPGVVAAEAALREEAAREGRSLEDVRRDRQGLFDRWTTEQTQADAADAVARYDPPRPPGPRGG